MSFELFRRTVFSPLPYLSNSSLFPLPFQTSHRERLPLLCSLVHRSLAKSMVPDWSSSKRGSNSRTFDPLLGLLGQGENSTDSPALNVPLPAHSTIMSTVMCKNQHLYFLAVTRSISFPSPLMPQSLWNSSYLMFTQTLPKSQPCQSPADGQEDMLSYRRCCTLCWDSSHSTALERDAGLKAKSKWPALTHKHPLSEAVMDRQRGHAEPHEC